MESTVTPWVCDLWTFFFFFWHGWWMQCTSVVTGRRHLLLYLCCLDQPTKKINLTSTAQSGSVRLNFISFFCISLSHGGFRPYMFAHCRSCQPIPKEILLYNFCGISSCANSVVQCAISRKGLCTDLFNIVSLDC